MIGRHRIDVGETHMAILLDGDAIDAVRDAVFDARYKIEGKILDDPFFGVTHDPYPPDPKDPGVVRAMCRASVSAGVGPMAAVAGAVASEAIVAAVVAGCSFAVAENGGDIAYASDRGFTVGVYAGDADYPGLAVRIGPGAGAVCSSSGTVGHAFSRGETAVSTVFSGDAALADACATLLGNSPGDGMEDAVSTVASIEGVDGCFAISGNLFFAAGEIPDLVETSKEEVFSKITL